ncbi:hypothetical protein ACFL20_03445 [Spirochaetota bacterium]
MKSIKYNIIIRTLTVFLILFVFICTAEKRKVFSKFVLVEEDEDKNNVKSNKVKNIKKIDPKELPANISYNIKAVKIRGKKNSVKVSWDVNPKFTDEYFVGRSTEIIDTKLKALSSISVSSVPIKDKHFVEDSDLKTGRYYYVVLAKSMIQSRDIKLYSNINFTAEPVIIGDPQTITDVDNTKKDFIRNISIKKLDRQKVLVKWDKMKKKNIFYFVYRSNIPLDNEIKVLSSSKIATVVDVDMFVDAENKKNGIYYYAVTSKEIDRKESFYLKPGQTYTSEGIEIDSKKKVDKVDDIEIDIRKDENLFKVSSIKARKTKKGIQVIWTYNGSKGDDVFRLIRVQKRVKKLSDVESEDVIEEVDITERKYIDENPPEGLIYYALVPFLDDDNQNFKIENGVSIVKYPIRIKRKRIKTKTKTKTKAKIKTKTKTKTRKYREISSGQIEDVLRKTYYRGDYTQAIIELGYIINKSHNEVEIAKARLFSARSYIELRKYRKALKYLVVNDVNTYFPKEAKFWKDFAVSRIRDY